MDKTRDGLPLLAFANAEAFSLWLAAPTSPRGAWLKFAKSGAASTLSKEQAIDCALCHGWIDGQLGRLDDKYFLTRFTPRGRKSRWSARNAERAQALIDEGRMRPGGLAAIAAAKADGRFAAAYPSAAKIEAPPDFLAALLDNGAAAEKFAALDGANRYAILYRLHHAKADARARGIAGFVAMLARGETLHPPRQRRGSTETRRGLSGKVTPS